MEKSLLSCGFEKSGESFQYFSSNFSVIIVLPLQVYISAQTEIDQAEIDQKIGEIEQEEDFGFLLLEWINEKLTPEETPGFYSGSEEENETFFELIRYDRPLKIYTWGRKLRKGPPRDVQRNFNAAILNGKRKGVNLKKYDGRSEELQWAVKRCKMFPSLMMSVQEIIEKEDLHTIAFNCTRGRHRSVAAAELLRKLAYPNSEVIHLEI